MTFARTRDLALVRAVLTHESQVRMSSEDATDVATWSPVEDERIWYIEARDAVELVGIFTLIPQNSVCFEIHAAILPHAWGERSHEAARGVFVWMFANSPARRIVASIPGYNQLALKLAKDAGMRAFGRNPRSFLKHGKLHDQILLGISAS